MLTTLQENKTKIQRWLIEQIRTPDYHLKGSLPAN